MNGSETNAEFIRFLRYTMRPCMEVQSELYLKRHEERKETNREL